MRRGPVNQLAGVLASRVVDRRVEIKTDSGQRARQTVGRRVRFGTASRENGGHGAVVTDDGIHAVGEQKIAQGLCLWLGKGIFACRDRKVIETTRSIPVQLPVDIPIAVQINPVRVGTSLGLVGVIIEAIGVEERQKVKRDVFRNGHRPLSQIIPKQPNQCGGVRFVAAVDGANDYADDRSAPEAIYIQRLPFDGFAN